MNNTSMESVLSVLLLDSAYIYIYVYKYIYSYVVVCFLYSFLLNPANKQLSEPMLTPYGVIMTQQVDGIFVFIPTGADRYKSRVYLDDLW